MVLRIIAFFLATAGLASCLQYAPMKMQRRNYLGDKFRIDGYYYNMDGRHYDGQPKNVSTTAVIFYQNGFFSSITFSDTNLQGIDVELIEMNIPGKILGGSGYYQVSGDSISIEFWTNASHFPVPTATVPARIVNDTTLKSNILGHYKNDMWYFRPLSPKPDSTTIFDEQLEKGLPIKRGKKQKLLGII